MSAVGTPAPPRDTRRLPLRVVSGNAWLAVVTLRVLAAILVVRIALVATGANAEQPLVAGLIGVTQPLVSPFDGIYSYPADDAGPLPLDVAAALAIIALLAIAWLVGLVARAVPKER